jgi:20S proteasome subunit alpha 3
MEAISHAGAAVGVRTEFGVVLAAEKKILSKVDLFKSRSQAKRLRLVVNSFSKRPSPLRKCTS